MISIVARILFGENPKRYLVALVGFLGTFFLCAAVIVSALEAHWVLQPPVSYATCIDEKLRFLHELPSEKIENADIVSVGSSATWRNLDFSAWLMIQPDAHPVNIAPCYLHIDQTAYFARAMLKHTPNVETLLVVVHPRDFEDCRPDHREFVSEQDIEAYLFEKRSMDLKYLTNFRTTLIRDIINKLAKPAQAQESHPLMMDSFGSLPLWQLVPWVYPDFEVDPRCKKAVSHLEDVAAEAGARLVLVFLPIMENWANDVDPDRSKHRALRAWITDSLRRESTLVLDADTLNFPNEGFADPIHMLWPYTPILTRFIAEATVSAGTK